MKKGLKIYEVEFKGMYPVGNCLIIAAINQQEAEKIAEETITHSSEFIIVKELKIKESQVIIYLSGDY